MPFPNCFQTTLSNPKQSQPIPANDKIIWILGCHSLIEYRMIQNDTNVKMQIWWTSLIVVNTAMHWESQFYCKRIKEYWGASSSEDSLDTSANDLADSCPNANRSWHHFGMTQHTPTWPNYPLRLPLATLQLVRLKTSPASKVTSNRCLTWTNTQLSCRSCTCNLVICTSQVASMTLPASWHALQSFSVVLGSPVRIAAKQIYLHRSRQYKGTKSVSRNSKSWASQH